MRVLGLRLLVDVRMDAVFLMRAIFSIVCLVLPSSIEIYRDLVPRILKENGLSCRNISKIVWGIAALVMQ